MTPSTTIVAILLGMVALSFLEALLPLHERGRRHRAHLVPNLWLTFITFVTNALMNATVLALLSPATLRTGFLHGIGAVLGLDFSIYVAHRLMHARPVLWRFHAVHHSDPAVDVTTTIRQHPVEGAVRYAFLAAALAIGATPPEFAVYRLWSAVCGLFEHANVRVPRRLDEILSLVVVSPNFHKVHHSRRKDEANSNYGNITSLYDRLFATFTSSARGINIVYGLDGYDGPATQTTLGLLARPLRPFPRREDDANHSHGRPAPLRLA